MRRPPRLLPTAVALLAAALPATAGAAAPTDPQLTIYAGNGTVGPPVAGPALTSPRNSTAAMDVTSDGTLYALDLADHVVEKITPDGELSVVAGNGTSTPFAPGRATDSGLGNLSYALAAEDDGTLYIGDWATGRIAKVTPGGQLSVVAGNGTRGQPVDGPATSSPLGYATGLDTDAAGNLYFALQDQFAVVKVAPTGQLTRIAGTGQGGALTDGPALASAMVPRGGTVLPDGTYYVSNGVPSIARIAHGELQVIDTTVPTPVGMSHDDDGNLYVSSNSGARITRLGSDGSAPTPVAGNLTNGLFAFTPGDPLLSSFFSTVVAADPSGVLYTIDYPKQIGRIGAAVPSRPRAVTAVAEPGGDVTVSFVPPSNRGLTPIAGYDVSADGGHTWSALTTTTIAGGRRAGTVRDLAPGPHEMQVRARNSAGPGPSPAAPRTVVVQDPVAPTPAPPVLAPVAPAPAADTTTPARPAATVPPTGTPFLRVGAITASRVDGRISVALQTSGPGTIEAVATHTWPRSRARGRALVPGPGRLVYAATPRLRAGATTRSLVLHRTAAGRATRFRLRTIRLRVTTLFTPDGGAPVRRTVTVRVRTR